jgi:hypothetical protein
LQGSVRRGPDCLPAWPWGLTQEATKALGQAAQEVMGVAHDVVAGKPPGTSAAVQELLKDMEAGEPPATPSTPCMHAAA